MHDLRHGLRVKARPNVGLGVLRHDQLTPASDPGLDILGRVHDIGVVGATLATGADKTVARFGSGADAQLGHPEGDQQPGAETADLCQAVVMGARDARDESSSDRTVVPVPVLVQDCRPGRGRPLLRTGRLRADQADDARGPHLEQFGDVIDGHAAEQPPSDWSRLSTRRAICWSSPWHQTAPQCSVEV